MRKNRSGKEKNGYSMMILDDDVYILEALKQNFMAMGYEVVTYNQPLEALAEMARRHYDLLILDFIMTPICGDEVVARLRKFDTKIFVVLLTGHKEMAPPLHTIRELDIQGYCEKSAKYDQLELLVESSVKSIRQIRTIYRYQEGLAQILDSLPQMHQNLPIEESAGRILDAYLNLADCQDGFIWLKPERFLTNLKIVKLAEDVYCGRGCFEKDFSKFKEQDYDYVKTEIWDSLKAGGLVMDHEKVMLPLLEKKGVIIGVLCIKKGIDRDPVIRDLLSVYAEQVSTALHNNLLRILINANNQNLKEANRKMKESYMQTVEAMRLLVDAKDFYTRGHSDRVAYYAVELAKECELDEKVVQRIHTGGLLHDIGKIGVSDSILCKPDTLTEEEFSMIQKHPDMGEEILSCITMFENLGDIVCAHHEWYDGSGYPKGLRGEEIPLEARVIGIADAFDAMMSDRHYRRKLTLEKSAEELERGKGTQFDPVLVEHFLRVLKRYPEMANELKWTYE